MWWSQYTGKNSGRLMHFLHQYCGLNIAENAGFDSNRISLYGKPFATYEWSVWNVPKFDFVGENKGYYQIMQKQKRKQVILDLFGFPCYKRIDNELFLGSYDDRQAFSNNKYRVDFYLNQETYVCTIHDGIANRLVNYYWLVSRHSDELLPAEKELIERETAYRLAVLNKW